MFGKITGDPEVKLSSDGLLAKHMAPQEDVQHPAYLMYVRFHKSCVIHEKTCGTGPSVTLQLFSGGLAGRGLLQFASACGEWRRRMLGSDISISFVK